MKYYSLMNKLKIKNGIIYKFLDSSENKYIDIVKLYKLQLLINKQYFKINPKLIKSNILQNHSNILKNFEVINNITSKNINKIIKELYKIHSLPTFDKESVWTFASLYTFFLNNTKKIYFDYKKYAFLLKNKYLNDRTCNTVTHNDLHINNILFDGKEIKIIDFDFLNINDYHYDISCIISENNLSNEIIEKIFELYPKNLIKDKIMYYIKIEKFINSLWANYKYENTKNEIYKQIFIKKINELEQIIFT